MIILICLVWLCKNLSKLDHVSDHYRSLSCMVAITAAYPISICCIISITTNGVSLRLHLLSLDTVSHYNYDTRVAAHFANPERFHLGFSQRFLCFKASNPVGGTPFHPHLPQINIFQLFVRTTPVICWLMCMFMFL